MLTDWEVHVLANTFLFRGIQPEAIRDLLETVPYTKQVFRRGAVIYSPESFNRDLGIILAGQVVVTKGSFTVSELGAGDLFGAAALFTDEEQYVSTLTPRQRTQLLFLSQQSVQELIDRERIIRDNYIRYLAQRIRFLSAKVDTLSSGTGGRKLSAFLMDNVGEDGSLTVSSMTQLASRLGMGRATLYRELDRLQSRNIISRDGKTILLLKPELLQ